MITMKGNYIYHFSGRSPKVQGNTLLHVVSLLRFALRLILVLKSVHPGQQLLV